MNWRFGNDAAMCGHAPQIALACLAVFACIPPDTSAAETATADLTGRTVAFGKIRWIENGEERKEYKNAAGWNLQPQFLRVEDGDKGALEIDHDGAYAWALPRGTYILQQFQWTDGGSTYHVEPKVGFQVPGSANAQCLGTVIVKLETKRGFFGKLTIEKTAIDIQDNCDSIAQDFSQRHADPPLKVANSLMWYAPQMPDSAGNAERKHQPYQFYWPVPARRR
jgi:hypothetical protein